MKDLQEHGRPASPQPVPDARALHDLALALQQQGDIAGAEARCLQALALRPGDFDATHLLGVLTAQRGDLPLAAQRLEQALAIDANHASARLNLGVAYENMGRLEDALANYDRALLIHPDDAAVHLNRGDVLFKLGRPQEAADSYGRVVAQFPDHVVAHVRRGLALGALQRHDEALACHDRALAIRPDLAPLHVNRANVLCLLRRAGESLASYDRAIAIDPDEVQAHYNRGNALLQLDRPDEAIESYDRVIARVPDHAQAHGNRGVALSALLRHEEALACHERAVAIEPESAPALTLHAAALAKLLRTDEALASFDRALRIDPACPEAQLGKAALLLREGQFERGWPLYEWRWKTDEARPMRRDFAAPPWLGVEELAGRTLLLHAEQGLGDTIQFCRYAALVKARGARIVLEVPRPLVALLSTLDGVDEIVEKGRPLPAFDFHCPLMSLALALGTTLDAIPNRTPYLRVDAQRRATWSATLGVRERPRVGVVWNGSPSHRNDRNRSMRLETLLRGMPDRCELVSLQQAVRPEDEEAIAGGRLRHFGGRLESLADTAALCDLMDLVVSVDTSVAHLAGALGKPTRILLPHSPDWRWLLGRDDSPWYPSVRLVRQDADRRWEPVLARVAAELPAVLD